MTAGVAVTGSGSTVPRRRMPLRWRVTYLLGRSKRLCWADLVSWALNYCGDAPMLPSSKGCRAESLTHRHRACYCGKFQNGECAR